MLRSIRKITLTMVEDLNIQNCIGMWTKATYEHKHLLTQFTQMHVMCIYISHIFPKVIYKFKDEENIYI